MKRGVTESNGTYGPTSAFARDIYKAKYAHQVNGRKEEWAETATRVAGNVMRPYLPQYEDRVRRAIAERKFMPGGRYLYATGRRYPQISNCFLLRVGDSKEEWGRLMNTVTVGLMTGGGVGVVYSDLRGEDSDVTGLGGKSTGPCALMRMVNEAGRYIMQGGSRRSAIWAGLHWWHTDVFKFIHLKDHSPQLRVCKEDDINFPLPMDGTNISVILDDAFFAAYANPAHADHYKAHAVYWAVIKRMLKTGEPGFSVDVGPHAGHNCRNACCEITSADDSDNCNLGSLNLARISSLAELEDLVEATTAFLLCGTLYGVLPVQRMIEVRDKNRRIGLGLMGVHEWLLRRGHRYGPNEELAEWLAVYRHSTEHAAALAHRLGISTPVATRSVAPTGTISIVAETTSAAEPIFAAALLRRWLEGKTWREQVILDPTARRLVAAGCDPAALEDAYTLAEDVERRIQFQSWLQGYVDHGISSTINLPAWGSSLNNESTVQSFGDTLLKYLPSLRGITAYPDGARGGQPLTRVSYADALKYVGVEEKETAYAAAEQTGHDCRGGFCAS